MSRFVFGAINNNRDIRRIFNKILIWRDIRIYFFIFLNKNIKSNVNVATSTIVPPGLSFI